MANREMIYIDCPCCELQIEVELRTDTLNAWAPTSCETCGVSFSHEQQVFVDIRLEAAIDAWTPTVDIGDRYDTHPNV
jgi:transcription elongation factor Elf1